MSDQRKTKAQLMEEVASLRQRLAECEAAGGRGSEPQGEQQLRAEIAKRKLVEASLRRSQQDYQTLFESVIDGTVVIDTETMSIVLANDRAVQMYGFESVDDLSSVGLLDCIHPEDRDMAVRIMTEGILEKDLRQVNQFRTFTRDGREVWIEAVGVRIEYHGRPGILASFRDITERKRAEEEGQERMRELEFLSRTAMELVQLPPEADVHQYISRWLSDLAGDEATVLVSSFDRDTESLSVQAMAAPDRHVAAVVNVLGKVPVGISAPISQEARRGLAASTLEKVAGGLSELASGALPAPVCRDIEKALGITEVRAIGLSWQGEVSGSAALLLCHPVAPASQRTIEAFIRQVSMALQRRLAQEALHRSERRYHLLAENASDVIWTTDLELRPTYISPSVAHVRGYTVEEAMSQPFEERFPAASVEAIREVLADYQASEAAGPPDRFASRSVEMEMIRSDGSTVWVDTRVTVLRDADGQPQGYLGVTRDISDRKAMEEALRRSEYLYRTVIESARDGILITDTEERIVDANPTLVASTGYGDREQLIGRSVREIVAPRSLAELDSGWGESLRQVLREGKGYVTNVEMVARTAQGAEFPVEMSISRLADEAGRLTGFLHVVRDITERKRVEEALRELEEKFSKSFFSSPSPMVLSALPSGRILDVNDRFVSTSGYQREEATGRTSEELGLWVEPQSRAAILRMLEEHGRVRDEEVEFRMKSGDTRTFLYSAEPLEIGGEACLLTSVVDITQRKRAEEEAQRHARRAEALRAVSATVNHTLDLEEMLGSVLATAVDVTGTDAGYIHLLDGENQQLVLRTHHGISGGYAAALEALKVTEEGMKRWSQYPGPAFRAAHILEDADLVLGRRAATEDGLSLKSFVVIPIWSRGELYGGLSLLCKAPRRYAADELELLKAIGNEIAVGIANARLYEQAREATRAMEEERDRAQTYFDSAAVMMVVLDAEGKVQSINRRGCQVLGCEEAEVVGRDWFDSFLPEAVRPGRRELHRAAFAGEPGLPESYESPVLTRDGRHRDIVWHIVMLRDWQGNAVERFACGEDITERREMEDALRQSEQKYRMLVENIPQKVFHKDRNSVYVTCNASYAQDLKIDPSEIAGKTDFDFYPEELAEKYRADDRRVVESGEAVSLEEGYVHNGQESLVETFKVPILDEGGEVSGVLGVFHDITGRKRMEEALRASEEFSTNLLANLPTPTVVINADTSVRYVNPALERLTGFAADEVVGVEAPYPWWTPETAEETDRDLSQAMVNGAHKVEELFRRKDGERFLVEVTSTPVKLNGEFQYYLANWVDITESREMEEALIQSEEQYRELAESITDLFFALDSELRYTYWNRASEEVTGIRAGDALGKRLFDVFPHDEPTRQAAREYQKVLETGVPRSFVNAYRLRDGEFIFEISAYPTATGVVVFCRDITERKAAQDALRASEEKYRSLVDSMLDGYLVVRGSRILFANKVIADSVGTRPGDLTGASFLPLLTADSRERSREIYESTRRGEAPPNLAELALVTEDGATVAVEATIREIDYGGERAYSVLVRDITERKRSEEALRGLERRLRSLASRLAVVEERERRRLAEQVHDRIGQPLAILKIKLGGLRPALSAAGLEEQLDELRQLLDQALEDTRSVTFELSPPILHQLGLEPALEWLADQVEEYYRLPCQFEDDGQSKPLGDDTRAFLFRAAHELLMNVVRHAHAQQVKLSACRRDGDVQVTVEDDGVGFDTSKAERRTSGFGLFSIDQRLTELGGHLEIQSKPGKGTRVTLVVALEGTDSEPGGK